MKVQESSAAYEVFAQSESTDNWALVPLKDLGKWSGGGTPSKSKLDYWEGGTIPWVSPKDMKTAHIVDSEDHITKAAVEESTAKLISAGSVLVVTRSGILSHTLPVALTTVPVTVNQDLKALTPKEGVLPEYVAWALRCFAREILNTCSKQGTTVSSIETAALHRFEIPLAPLNQQKRIVAEIEKQFSRLDEAVANLKRVKANLKRYKAAVLKAAVEGRLVETEAERARRESRSYETGEQLLQRILETRRSQWQGKGKYKEPAAPDTTNLPELPEGWVWVSTESVAFVTKLAGFEYTKFVKYSPDGDLAVIKAENAGPNGFKRTDFSRVTSSTVSQLTRSQLRSGDLLMVFVGAGTGQVARVPDDQPYFLGPNIAMIRVESCEISSSYLEMFLRSPIGNSLALSFAKAVAQPSLSMGSIRMIPIAIPVLSEQHRIVAEVDRRFSHLYEIEAQVAANLKRARRLRHSILMRVFKKPPQIEHMAGMPA